MCSILEGESVFIRLLVGLIDTPPTYIMQNNNINVKLNLSVLLIKSFFFFFNLKSQRGSDATTRYFLP